MFPTVSWHSVGAQEIQPEPIVFWIGLDQDTAIPMWRAADLFDSYQDHLVSDVDFVDHKSA